MQIFLSYTRTKLGIEKHLADLIARFDEADFEVFRDAKAWSEGALDQVLERIADADIFLSIVSDAALVIRRHETGRYFISDVFLPVDDQPNPGRRLDLEAISAILRDNSAPRVVVLARDEHGASHCVSWISGALAELIPSFAATTKDRAGKASAKLICARIKISLEILYGVDTDALYVLRSCGVLQIHKISEMLRLAPSRESRFEESGPVGGMPGFDLSRKVDPSERAVSETVVGDCDMRGSGSVLGGSLGFEWVSSNDREWKLLLFAALLLHVVPDYYFPR
jgi:hypothetical protein